MYYAAAEHCFACNIPHLDNRKNELQFINQAVDIGALVHGLQWRDLGVVLGHWANGKSICLSLPQSHTPNMSALWLSPLKITLRRKGTTITSCIEEFYLLYGIRVE